jgi:hypothetical protein
MCLGGMSCMLHIDMPQRHILLQRPLRRMNMPDKF